MCDKERLNVVSCPLCGYTSNTCPSCHRGPLSCEAPGDDHMGCNNMAMWEGYHRGGGWIRLTRVCNLHKTYLAGGQKEEEEKVKAQKLDMDKRTKKYLDLEGGA